MSASRAASFTLSMLRALSLQHQRFTIQHIMYHSNHQQCFTWYAVGSSPARFDVSSCSHVRRRTRVDTRHADSPTLGGGAENAGVENAGVENAGADSRGIATDELSR